MLRDLVMAVLAGVAVAAGLGFVGAGVLFGLPAEVALVAGAVVATAYFIWRRQDPEAHLSPRERLERDLFH